MDRFGEDKAPNKTISQRLLYRAASDWTKSDGLIVSGPAYYKHIKNYFSTVGAFDKSVLHLSDMDLDVIRYIKAQMKNHDKYTGMVSKGRVRLHPYDVKKVPHHCNFQDIDLMVTWRFGMDIFRERLQRQKQAEGAKAFLFTVSLRNGKGKADSINKINDLLSCVDARITGLDGNKGSYEKGTLLPQVKSLYAYNHTPDIKDKGRLCTLTILTYTDSGMPMMTGMILYK